MPRALTVHRAIVPAGGREEYLARLGARKAHFKRANCNFWVFEESEMQGAFLEFTEAADAATLTAALAAAPDAPPTAPRVYTEIVLS